MRHTITHKTEQIDSRNPVVLASKDIQAFGIVREYAACLRTKQTQKAASIKHANPDLRPYFAFVFVQFRKNPYYAI